MSLIKVLAIDFGEIRIGLAVGDYKAKVASTKNHGYENVCNEIVKIVDEWQINRIVIGMPEIFSDQKINKKIKHFEII